MRRDSIAEWILATVTCPDRATTIVGDLLEDRATRNGLAFWLNVFRSAGSLLWKTFADQPAGLLGLALKAWLRMWLFLILLLLLAIASVALFGLVSAAVAGQQSTDLFSASWRRLSSLAQFIELPVIALVEYRIGLWIASRAPGRDMPVCIVLVVLEFLLGCAAGLIVCLAWGNGAWQLDWTSPLMDLPFLFGALQIRRRRAICT